MVKEGYKEVRIGPKLKLIPDGWKIYKLKNIISKRKGKRPNNLFENKIDEKFIPYLSVNYLRGNELPKWCSKEDNNKVEVNENEILMIWDGSYSGNVFTGFNGALSSTMAKLKCGKETNNKYLFYQLKNNFKVFQSTTIGTSVPHVAGKVFENLNIPTPSKREQKKIASILSSVDKTIEKTDEVIEKTKELKKGLMQQLLTKGIGHSEFKEVRVGTKLIKIPTKWDLLQFNQVYKKRNKRNKEARNYRYIGLEHIESGNINLIDYDKNGKERSSSRMFEEGDILYGKLRPYLDKAAISKFDGICSTDIIPIYSTDLSTNEYLLYLLHSKYFVDFAVSTMEGTNLPRTSWRVIKNLNIPVPPLEEQKKIASILSSVDEKIKKEEEYKSKLERLKKGLMQKLLTGEIRVNTESEV